MQESETRFGTHYQVAERFLKATPEIYSLLDSHLGASARALYSSLKKTSNNNGNITGYPAMEAVFDAFGVVADCIEQFEVSKRPTIHIALPLILQMMQKSGNITNGLQVWRGEGKPRAYHSAYSRALTRVIHERMLNHVWYHPLLLVGCFLNPLFRDFEFIPDNTYHTDYRSKAMDFTRTLCGKEMLLIEQFAEKKDAIFIDSSDSEYRNIKITKQSGRRTCT